MNDHPVTGEVGLRGTKVTARALAPRCLISLPSLVTLANTSFSRTYLIQSKFCDVKRVIEPLSAYGNNYFKAWELLDRRCNNQRALVTN